MRGLAFFHKARYEIQGEGVRVCNDSIPILSVTFSPSLQASYPLVCNKDSFLYMNSGRLSFRCPFFFVNSIRNQSSNSFRPASYIKAKVELAPSSYPLPLPSLKKGKGLLSPWHQLAWLLALNALFPYIQSKLTPNKKSWLILAPFASSEVEVAKQSMEFYAFARSLPRTSSSLPKP